MGGDDAQKYYLEFLNTSRRSIAMFIDSDNPKKLDPKMHTKRALLQTLSTKAWILVHDLEILLSQQGVKRSKSAIRRGLQRMKNFGLAIDQKAKDRYGSKQWQLTQYGASIPPTPVKPPKVSKTRSSKGKGGTQKSSKGSSGSGTTMCMPNKPTLVDATTKLVSELVAAQKTFSAYEVTKQLRELAKDGKVSIDKNETGSVWVTGVEVPKIVHDDIRDIVHDLFNNGKLSGYDRQHNGTYFEYQVATAPVAVTPVASVDPAADPVADAPVVDTGSYSGDPTL